jgi:SAM-dependent methyltransferase
MADASDDDPGRDVVRFFDQPRALRVAGPFRALCNGLKAALIDAGLRELARAQRGRLRVLDLGSGRGGDLSKWARYRVWSYLGLDASRHATDEAEARLAALLREGRGALPAHFAVIDCRRDRWPVADGSIDVVSAHFILQFFFDEEASLAHVLGELRRVLAPGGVLLGILPDGDRVAALLPRRTRCGHFEFRAADGAQLRADPPLGIAYTFRLRRADGCQEFVVAPQYLEQRLLGVGLLPTQELGALTLPAQRFCLLPGVLTTVEAVINGGTVSEGDWESVAALRVVLARSP